MFAISLATGSSFAQTGRRPAASPGVGVAGAIISRSLGTWSQVNVALGAAVFVIRRELRPAFRVVDENGTADAVKAEIYVGAGEHAALTGCEYPEAGQVVLLSSNWVWFSGDRRDGNPARVERGMGGTATLHCRETPRRQSAGGRGGDAGRRRLRRFATLRLDEPEGKARNAAPAPAGENQSPSGTDDPATSGIG